MKTMQFIILLFLIPGYASHLQGQDVPEVLKSLTVLEGTWHGEGSQSTGPDNMILFEQTEQVSAELDGNLMVFRGTGTTKGEKEPSFRAYGVMSYDSEDEQVYIHAWTNDGRYTRAPVTLGDNTFSWQFDVENEGMVRYSAEFSKDRWTEKGEYSPDNGKTWYQFMTMDLSR